MGVDLDRSRCRGAGSYRASCSCGRGATTYQLTSFGGGVHDEGNLGDEGAWATTTASADPAGVGAEAMGGHRSA